ncbi:MAG: ABC transporter permease, partial [Erysipelotrichia bacterium]|nr:ABC transporter permease [Erysipelotrichia bacterium]
MTKVVKHKMKKRFNFRSSLGIPFGVFMVLFVIFPLFLVLYFAFTDANGAFTINNWSTVFSNAQNWKVIGTTFIIAATTTAICLLIAYPIAYLLANKKYNKNVILVYIFLLPMWINFVIRTIGLKALVNGFTSAAFGYDITATHPIIAIIIGMVYDYLPFAI